MANWEQIDWLLENGIAAWNQRVNEEPNFIPNFEDAELDRSLGRRYRDDRGRIDLSEINLNNSKLANVNLENCVLNRATLANADLTGAKLTGASLYCADLTRTDLTKTNLIGVDLTASEIWKARLFDERENWRGGPPLADVPETVETVGALVKTIEDLTRGYSGLLDETIFYFRGETQAGWPLKPSVMRSQLFQREARMLVDLMSLRPAEFDGMNSALSQWVLAQHHGLKTRFLDISKNPLVALFNACRDSRTEETENKIQEQHEEGKNETKGNHGKDGLLHIFAVPPSLIKPFNSDTISVVSNFAKMKREEQYLILSYSDPAFLGLVGVTYHEALGHLYQLIQQEKPYFAERINPKDLYKVFIVEPQQNLERIRAQSGAFLVSAFQEQFDSESILAGNSQIPIYDHFKLTIPSTCKGRILRELRLLNIKNETLFPGLDTSAEAVVNRNYQQMAAYGESFE